MNPARHRFPSRGSVQRRPMSHRQMNAMLPPPPPGPNIGAFADIKSMPQDVVGAIVGQLRTSMLDIGTAVRLGHRGRRVFFGTELTPPHEYVQPAFTNSPDQIRAAAVAAGNARRTLGKNASRGVAQGLPGPGVLK